MCALFSNAFVRKQSKATSLLSSTEGLKKSAVKPKSGKSPQFYFCLFTGISSSREKESVIINCSLMV